MTMILKFAWAMAAAAILAAPASFAQTVSPAQPAAAAAPIPIEAFAALPFITDPVLSPDGSRIAARLYLQGKERVGIFRIGAGPDAAPRMIDAGEDHDLRGIQWAGNNRLLIRLGMQSSLYGVQVPVTRMIVHDLATGASAAVRAGNGFIADDIIFTDPDGAFILLSSQRDALATPSVYRVDLSNGRSQVVQHERPGVWNWFADSRGVVRAGVDYGERRLKIYYRQAAGGDLRLIENRRVSRDDSVVDGIRFIEDTSRGVIISNAETGRFTAYEYDFATDTRGQTLFEHPEVDASAIVPGEDGRIDGILYEDDRPRVHWLNQDLQRLQGAIDRALPGKRNVIRGRSAAGDRVLIWSGGADDPGAYYIYTPSARRIDAFAAANEALYEQPLAPVRPIRYRSRDGLDIRGYLTLPKGRPERGLPLIVMPHGGPFARDSWTFDAQVQFLASRGYAVLQPNFRGSTGYGREFVERGYGQWGTGMIDDIDDGVEWLANEGTIDRSRVCIMGGSYGGYAALWGAIRSPQRYRCAVSFAGVTDVRAMLRYDARFLIASRYMRDWRRKVQGEEGTDLAAISPLQQAARITVPVLIAHGEKDKTVPVSQSRSLVRALTRRNASVQSVFYPEAAHGFSRPEDSADFLRRVEAFLAQHNPA